MPKKITKSTYIDEFKSDVKALISEANRYLTLTHKQSYTSIRRLGAIDYEYSAAGYHAAQDFEKKSHKLAEAYQKLQSYKFASTYTDITKQFMQELKDSKPSENETEEDVWEDVYKEYKDELDDMKYDITEAYREYLRLYADLIRYVKEKQRKEAISKMGTNGRELTVQEYVENADEIRRLIYERCSNGEYDVDTREAMLQRLTEYKFTHDGAADAVLEAVSDFIEYKITPEELDNILTGYYQENMYVEDLFNPDYLDDMYEIMRESVSDQFHDGYFTASEAKEQLEKVDLVYETDMSDYYARLFTGELIEESTEEYYENAPEVENSKLMEIFNAYTDCREAVLYSESMGYYTEEEADAERERLEAKFDDMMESYLENGESVEYLQKTIRPDFLERVTVINEAVAEEELTDDEGYAQYKEAVEYYYNDFFTILEAEQSDPTAESENSRVVDTKKIAKINGVITSLIATPVNKPVRGPKGMKVLQAYDEIHKPTVPFSKIKFRKLSPKKDAELISKYGGSPEGVTGGAVGVSGNENFLVVITKGETSEVYGISPEFKNHDKYYRAGVAFKVLKMQDATTKEFLRSLMADCSAIVKKEEKIEDKIEKVDAKADKNLDKIVKESTADVADIYVRTIVKINALFESGKIDDEKREALTLEARRKLVPYVD